MALKHVEGGRTAGMAAETIILILMFAGGVGVRVYEIASGNMILDHGNRRQDWW